MDVRLQFREPLCDEIRNIPHRSIRLRVHQTDDAMILLLDVHESQKHDEWAKTNFKYSFSIFEATDIMSVVQWCLTNIGDEAQFPEDVPSRAWCGRFANEDEQGFITLMFTQKDDALMCKLEAIPNP